MRNSKFINITGLCPKIANSIIVFFMSVLLFGCSSDNDEQMTVTPPSPPVVTSKQFQVTFTNNTNAQPLSPIAFVMHQGGTLWTIGSSATNALEVLAESGDNSEVLAETIVIRSASGSGVVMPGASQTVNLSFTDDLDGKSLSAVTMLVNTNDAFTGFTGMDISEMMVGASNTFNIPSYDSGTEGNSEMAGTIPGPADSGEGFNSARDDSNQVTRHTGVVTMDDGLSSSILTEAHRWDNPVARVTVTRIE